MEKHSAQDKRSIFDTLIFNLFYIFLFVSFQVSYMDAQGESKYHHLLAIPTKAQLVRVLKYVLDENEFLSPYGIRSLSLYHKDNPYKLKVGDEEYSVEYVPGESNTFMFGGNSNWRGPIWLCSK